MTEQEYQDKSDLISEGLAEARKARDRAQNLMDDLLMEEVVLSSNWAAQQRSGTGYPYKEGDIVHFHKASLPANRTRDYEVTKVTPEELYVEATSGEAYSHTHDDAERLGVLVVAGEGL